MSVELQATEVELHYGAFSFIWKVMIYIRSG